MEYITAVPAIFCLLLNTGNLIALANVTEETVRAKLWCKTIDLTMLSAFLYAAQAAIDYSIENW